MSGRFSEPSARILDEMAVIKSRSEMASIEQPDQAQKDQNGPLTYASSGVDIDAQDEAIRRLTPHARATFTANVLSDVGQFSAAFKGSFPGMAEPVLVSSTDGVGTKLKYSSRFAAYRNAGVDLVSTCINDIVCSGATPLFFLDYIGINKVVPGVIEELVKGMSDACIESGCSLIGGEIAEMPDIYAEGEFDLVGFAVGVVDKAAMLPRHDIVEGDAIIGLASSGLHCNGLTLARKALESIPEADWHTIDTEIGCSLAEEVTKPARIYAREARALLESGCVKAFAHISGGGIVDNIPRVLPKNLGAIIDGSSFPTPPIFAIIARLGRVDQHEMYRVFNMGIGFAAVVPSSEVESCMTLLSSFGAQAYPIGMVKGGSGVILV